MQLSVIVPAYNEAARIAPTLQSIRASQPAAELIVVDDGSTDDTIAVARSHGATVLTADHGGKGHAVRTGMLAARGELRLYMDADNATPISELPKLIAAIDDVAIGSRRAPGGHQHITQPWYRRAWSTLANRVVQRLLLDGIRDTQCGFKLFTAAAADAIFSRVRTPGWGFDLEVLVIARKLGLSIAEVGVAWSDDRRSRIRPVRDAIHITGEMLAIRRAMARGDYDP